MSLHKHPEGLSSYLRRSGVTDGAIYRNPEAAAELSRISFLQENWLKARDEQRSFIWMIIAAPITAPMFYLFHPSLLMLCCSVGFAAIVIATGVRQVLRRRQTMRDYLSGMERLVQIVRKHEARSSDETA
jgi:hypothetical protein